MNPLLQRLAPAALALGIYASAHIALACTQSAASPERKSAAPPNFKTLHEVLSQYLDDATQQQAPARPPGKRSTWDRPLSVSLLQLIARPEEFDGEYVRAIGFYRTEHEGTSIYLHREDYEQAITKNALWVSRDTLALDRKHVLIEGRFNAKGQGHMGLFSGEINDVSRMMLWPPAGVR